MFGELGVHLVNNLAEIRILKFRGTVAGRIRIFVRIAVKQARQKAAHPEQANDSKEQAAGPHDKES
jgi:hypothetical protein